MLGSLSYTHMADRHSEAESNGRAGRMVVDWEKVVEVLFYSFTVEGELSCTNQINQGPARDPRQVSNPNRMIDIALEYY